MSSLMPERPTGCETPWRIGVAASLYNPEWVEGLVSNFRSELKAVCPRSSIQVHWVPGSFELPLAADLMAAEGYFQCVAAFGVLLDGSTAHATLVAQAITQQLLQSSITHRIPVLHEVLLVKDQAQAEARCLGSEINRGIEAARAAVRMLRAVDEIRKIASVTKGPSA
jgi:6,7-dimethyl-8-ribityllumazine synthase